MHSIRKIFPFLSTVTDSRNTFRLRFVFGMFLERNRWIGSSSGMSTASSDCRICMSEIRFANCTNKMLDNISLPSGVNMAKPSFAYWKCLISFSRSIESSSLAFCWRW